MSVSDVVFFPTVLLALVRRHWITLSDLDLKHRVLLASFDVEKLGLEFPIVMDLPLAATGLSSLDKRVCGGRFFFLSPLSPAVPLGCSTLQPPGDKNFTESDFLVISENLRFFSIFPNFTRSHGTNS